MRVLSFGSLNIDNVYAVDHIVQPGETQTACSLSIFPGGKGLNQSIALAKAGVEVYHAGQVGDDGELLLETLQKAHVRTDYVREVPGRSGHAVIQLDKNAQNCIIIHGGTNRTISETMIDSVLSHFVAGDLILLQNEINGLDMIIDKAYARGMLVCLNPSPYDDALKAIDMGKIAIFLMNEVEGWQMTGVKEPEAIIETIRRRYPETKTVLTLGGDGSLYYDGSEIIRQAIYPVKAVDTTAAGDTFTGYFLAGFIEGRPSKEILDRASRAAAIAVSRMGAAVSIPTTEEVDSFVLS